MYLFTYFCIIAPKKPPLRIRARAFTQIIKEKRVITRRRKNANFMRKLFTLFTGIQKGHTLTILLF